MEYMQNMVKKANQRQVPLLQSSQIKTRFRFSNRWTETVKDGSIVANLGKPVTLTWSYLPDGTSITGYNGEGTSASQLYA